MSAYRVRWEIDVEDAESPREAAEEAWEAMRAPGSIANVFEVRNGASYVVVDLNDPEEER